MTIHVATYKIRLILHHRIPHTHRQQWNVHHSKHSQREKRNHALGKIDEGRLLHITFTLRKAGEKIRVISARDMHKERKIYEQTT